MRIAPYWARGEFTLEHAAKEPIKVSCRGFSDSSAEDARRNARSRAEKIAHRLADNTRLKAYEYGSGPLPEEVLEKYEASSGDLFAAITRNAYGALVLNVRDLMFVDIDSAHSGSSPSFLRFLGIGSGKSSEDALKQKVQDFIAETPRLGARLYRTAAGYRLLIIGTRFAPEGEPTASIFKRFGADPLYAKLCRAQGSFRARLTPKPWRIGLTPPPVTFPFETADSERKLSTWVQEYEEAGTAYATCTLIAEAGETERDAAYAKLISKHDEQTRAKVELALA